MRQEQGIAVAKNRGVRFGGPETHVPDNFGEIIKKWENEQIKFGDAIQECNMSQATFYRRLREYHIGGKHEKNYQKVYFLINITNYGGEKYV